MTKSDDLDKLISSVTSSYEGRLLTDDLRKELANHVVTYLLHHSMVGAAVDYEFNTDSSDAPQGKPCGFVHI